MEVEYRRRAVDSNMVGNVVLVVLNPDPLVHQTGALLLACHDWRHVGEKRGSKQ